MGKEPFYYFSEDWQNEYNFYHDPDACAYCDMNPCECYDDVCCFDPMYQGSPGSCHCKEYAEAAAEKQHKWYNKIYYILINWVGNKWELVKHWNDKKRCTCCDKESLSRKWKGNMCPLCKELDLPF